MDSYRRNGIAPTETAAQYQAREHGTTRRTEEGTETWCNVCETWHVQGISPALCTEYRYTVRDANGAVAFRTDDADLARRYSRALAVDALKRYAADNPHTVRAFFARVRGTR